MNTRQRMRSRRKGKTEKKQSHEVADLPRNLRFPVAATNVDLDLVELCTKLDYLA